MPTLRLLLPAALFLLAPAPASAAASPTVAPAANAAVHISIRADTIQSCNGTSAIPDGLFGVTAYEGAETAAEPSWRGILLRSGIRWAGLPSHPEWTFGEQLPEGFADGWADGPAATAKLDGPSPGYHIPRAVQGWRDLGIEPMLYLLGYPAQLDGGVSSDGKVTIPDFPKDVPTAARMWAEYVAWIRRADPDLTWLHLGNEDNASWWKLQKYGKDYAVLFNAVAEAVKARNPGVRIGGPVPCWAPSWPPAQEGTPDWYTWSQWTEPFIAASGKHLDFFDFHLYESAPEIGNEEVQTVANAMWLATKERKPVMITEYGVYLKPEDLRSGTRVWNRRVEPWQRQLMDFLDFQADTVLSLQPHDLFAEAGGQFTFLKGRDPADQFPLFRAYQTWAPLRGTRVACRNDGTTVRSFAALSKNEVDGSRALAVVLVNTSDEPQEVVLALEGAALRPGPVQQRSLRLIAKGRASVNVDAVPGGQEGFQNAEQGGVNAGPVTKATPENLETAVIDDGSRIEYAELFSDRAPTSVALAARETRSLLFALEDPAAAARRNDWIRTAFGDIVHRDFDHDGDTVVVHFTPPAGTAQSASLRVGLLGARPGDRIEVSIDGTTAVLANEWFQEIPLPRVPATSGVVTASFTLVTRGSPHVRPQKLRFGSAVLTFRGEEVLAPTLAPAVAADAPAQTTWSFVPRAASLSALEDPWRGAVQSITNLPLNEALVLGPAPVGRLLAIAHGGAERSPCNSLLFRAPRTGWYRLACDGILAGRNNETAGNALVTVYVLPHDAQSVRELAAVPLNTPGGFGGYPQDLAWSGQVWLRAGWQLGIGLQVVSPGPANGGRAELELSKVVASFLDAGR